jgi:sirohydrochlorin cobaltochelatase
VLVGHGTRSAAGVAEFRRFVERVRGLADDELPAVDGGFIELSNPSLTEAVARMPIGTHPEMVAVPLVLTAAGHVKGDIPAWGGGGGGAPPPPPRSGLAVRPAARPASRAA